VVVSTVALAASCVGLATGRVTAFAEGETAHAGILELGLEWIGFLFGVLLMAAGVVRLIRHDSQGRGMLLVSGVGVAALTVWEIITIQDRLIHAILLTVSAEQRGQAEVVVKQAFRDGRFDLTPNLGMYLLVVGGVLAVGAAVLAYARARPAAPTIPAAPAPHSARGDFVAPATGGAGSLMVEVRHGSGERCRACGAILGEASDTCWYCGKTWEPQAKPS
jgi:hypothetical protein